jgi:hypothetical protein
MRVGRQSLRRSLRHDDEEALDRPPQLPYRPPDLGTVSSSYLRYTRATCLQAFSNGGAVSAGVRIVGRSRRALLREATTKLELPFAARRLFDAEGRELLSDADCHTLPREASVYVSCGEQFKDPFTEALAQLSLRSRPGSPASGPRPGSAGTPAAASSLGSTGALSLPRPRSANGVAADGRGERGRWGQRTAPAALGDTTRRLSGTSRLRALVFASGTATRGHQLVLGPQEAFLRACSGSVALSQRAAHLYDMQGREISEAGELGPCPGPLQVVIGRVAGPLWVATPTEGFDPAGPMLFLAQQQRRLQRQLEQWRRRPTSAAIVARAEELYARRTAKTGASRSNAAKTNGHAASPSSKAKALDTYADDFESDDDDGSGSSATAASDDDSGSSEDRGSVLDADFDAGRALAVLDALHYLEQQSRALQKRRDAADGPQTARLVPAIDSSHRLLSKGGLKLHLFPNGSDMATTPPAVVIFNVREAERSATANVPGESGGPAQVLLQRLLDRCTQALSQGTTLQVRRLFYDDGREVRHVHKLPREVNLWASYGEALDAPFTSVLELDIRPAVRLQDETGAVVAVVEDDAGLLEPPRTGAKAWSTLADVSDPGHKGLDKPRALKQYAPAGLDALRHGGALCTDAKEGAFALVPDAGAASVTLALPKARAGEARASLTPLQRWLVIPLEGATTISGAGLVYLAARQAPALCLAVGGEAAGAGSETEASTSADRHRSLTFQVRRADDTAASASRWLWSFHPDGTVRPASHPDLCLSFPPGAAAVDVTARRETDLFLAPLAPSGSSLGRAQRWGLRQDAMATVGQWKLSRHVNPNRVWRRRALLWPANRDGSLIVGLAWPIDAAMVAFAPWADTELGQSPAEPKSGDGERASGGRADTDNGEDMVQANRRLRVIRNHGGAPGLQAEIVIPALPGKPHARGKGGLGSDLQVDGSYPVDTCRWFEKRFGADWRHVVTAPNFARSREHLVAMQLQLFLESCVKPLEFITAPRMLYTSRGARVTDLSLVHTEEVLQVSCGEPFEPGRPARRAAGTLRREHEAMREIQERLKIASALAVCIVQESSGDKGPTVGIKGGPDAAASPRAEFQLLPSRQLSLQNSRLSKALGWSLAASQLRAGAPVSLKASNSAAAEQKWVITDEKWVATALDANLVLSVFWPSGQDLPCLVLAQKVEVGTQNGTRVWGGWVGKTVVSICVNVPPRPSIGSACRPSVDGHAWEAERKQSDVLLPQRLSRRSRAGAADRIMPVFCGRCRRR